MLFDPETIAVMRSIFDEVCEHIPPADIETKTRVATAILEKAKGGRAPIGELRSAARRALLRAA